MQKKSLRSVVTPAREWSDRCDAMYADSLPLGDKLQLSMGVE